jgi:phosphoribosylformylglycinamidine cyclo-ligase
MSGKITYKDAGVDIEIADRALESVAAQIRSTVVPGVIGKIGGFAATFRPDWKNFVDPVLVSATDGVGTKLKIAFMANAHDTVGIDLVAMNVNDLLVTGARPLFFLDYFATGKILPGTFEKVVSGIATGCKISGCALIGGETAEMPDFYAEGEYDLAGFCVGILDQTKAIDGSKIKAGDVAIGLLSSGLHSNGFSLVRKALLEREKYSLDTELPELGRPLGEELLTPTSIYVKPVLSVLDQIDIHGMVHITGGGFYGNIPRVLPREIQIHIDRSSWQTPPIFNVLSGATQLDDGEMFKTFNMGIGMVIIVDNLDVDPTIELFGENQQPARVIGRTSARGSDADPQVVIA